MLSLAQEKSLNLSSKVKSIEINFQDLVNVLNLLIITKAGYVFSRKSLHRLTSSFNLILVCIGSHYFLLSIQTDIVNRISYCIINNYNIIFLELNTESIEILMIPSDQTDWIFVK